MSIICLETEKEEVFSWELSQMIQQAIDMNDSALQTYIRSLWDDESWDSIVRKFNTEGSVWIVWWMDGVRALINLDESNSSS